MQSDFFKKHIYPIQDKLFRFARRITGSETEAEDVVQEVFEKIWRQGDHGKEVQNWEAWCMTMTRNQALNKREQSNRMRNRELPLQEQNSHSLGISQDNYTHKNLIEHIEDQMQRLPENQRLCMHLRDIEEMSYQEIADALDLTLAQVKTNIHRARKAMRNIIPKDILY